MTTQNDPCAKEEKEQRSLSILFSKRFKKLSEHAERLCYKEGQILFYEGHSPYGVYLIQKGKVLIGKTSTDDGEVIIGPSERPLGLSQLSQGTTHCCTGHALTDVEVLLLPRSSVLEWLKHIKR